MLSSKLVQIKQNTKQIEGLDAINKEIENVELLDDAKFEYDMEKRIEDNKMKKFKFEAKMVFLTYPKCDLTPYDFYSEFSFVIRDKNNVIVEFLACSEDHKTTEGKHIHAYAKFEKKIRTQNVRYFDVLNYHPHVEPVKDKVGVIKYIAGYTVKKKNDVPDLYARGIEVDKYLVANKKKVAYNLGDVVSKKKTINEWVADDPNNIFKYTNLVKNLHMYWNNQMMEKYYKSRINRVCFWIWGSSGIGKTSSVFDHFKDFDIYWKGQNKWWDKYVDQQYVLLDDFDTCALFHYLKIWADSYVFLAEVKSGFVYCGYRVFFITSNYSLEELMKKDLDITTEDDLKKKVYDSELYKAVKRRFIFIHADDFVGKNGFFDFDKAMFPYMSKLYDDTVVLNNENKNTNIILKVNQKKVNDVFDEEGNKVIDVFGNTKNDIVNKLVENAKKGVNLKKCNFGISDDKKKVKKVKKNDGVVSGKSFLDLYAGGKCDNEEDDDDDYEECDKYEKIISKYDDDLKMLKDKDNIFDVDAVYDEEKDIDEELKNTFLVPDGKILKKKRNRVEGRIKVKSEPVFVELNKDDETLKKMEDDELNDLANEEFGDLFD